jgi:Icc-related predicted phosphoesterase
MKIAVMSDLHQDFPKNDYDHEQELDCSVVVCAGDLQEGSGIDSLVPYVEAGKSVVFVPGNHEYYNCEINNTRILLRNDGLKYGVHILDRNVSIIDGVRFIGCTLWTDFALDNNLYVSKIVAGLQMNDFAIIKCNDAIKGILTVDNAIDLFKGDIAWMHSMLSEPFDGDTVVVTHHAPSIQSVDISYKGDRLNPAFASNLEDFILKFQPKLWIHGHCHNVSDYAIDKTRVICNPRGYYDYYKTYKPLIVEI